MNEKQDSVQRIQVGIMGLAAVLLVVGLANLVIDRASEETGALEAIKTENGALPGTAAGNDADKKSEPLAEMGLTPAPAETKGAPPQAAPAPKSATPAGQASGTGQIVPDLRPDPKLESRMDREP